MNIKNSDFAFSITLKLSDFPKCKANETFPTVSDFAVNSRKFGSYTECVASAQVLMDDLAKSVGDKLSVSAEVNPTLSGMDTRSKDWTPDELARLWIFNKDQEGARNIQALGQARIFALERSVSTLN